MKNIKKWSYGILVIPALLVCLLVTACTDSGPGKQPLVVTGADKDALQGLYDQYSNVDPEEYTDDSAAAFSAALAAAERVLDNPDAAQGEIDDAAAALEQAFSALVRKDNGAGADKDELQSLYDQYGAIDPDEYADDVAAAFRAALEELERVLNDPDATQEEVDAAVEALKSVLQDIVVYDTSYTPVYFNADSLTHTVTQLGDGVRYVKHRYTRTNGNNIEINMVEVNLEKATVVAAVEFSSGITVRGTPTVTHMGNWPEDNPGRKVMAATNGGFFDTQTYQPVDALVADGIIVKPNQTVPTVSAPMLFGVKGNKGQMGPMKQYTGNITDPGVRPGIMASTLTYAEDGSIKSEDGTWDGYTTIAGGGQALIIDGEIPDTVAMEQGHVADGLYVPRTAVGMIGDNIAVLINVECLQYNGSSGYINDPNDPKGMPFVQMADFFRYYGLTQAANFDGGGSTMMIYNDGYNGSGTLKLAVRSSDNGASWTNMRGRNNPYSLMAVTK